MLVHGTFDDWLVTPLFLCSVAVFKGKIFILVVGFAILFCEFCSFVCLFSFRF